MNLKYIGFDADDTLWVNETFFREAEVKFCEILKGFGDADRITEELYRVELGNIPYYGYGIKGFVLSMIESALRISNYQVSLSAIEEITAIGKYMLTRPVVLLDGIENVLQELKDKGYKLIVATKGDLLDQERKLEKSRLQKYFHHVEIMSDKKEVNYLKLLAHLEIKPSEFLMVGNSIKSDILPVLNIGGYGIHIPFHTTWVHEHMDHLGVLNNFWEVENASCIHNILHP